LPLLFCRDSSIVNPGVSFLPASPG
jgi:hypothetical protein